MGDSFLVPTGAVVPYAGGSRPSTGWLLCDGRAVSRTTYKRLFRVLGTKYGLGDGSTTYNLPDLRARFPIGMGGAVPFLGATGGTFQHTHTGGSHTHAVGTLTVDMESTHTHGVGSIAASSESAHTHGAGSLATSTTGAHTHDVTVPADPTPSAAGAVQVGREGTITSTSAGDHSHTMSGSTGAGSSHTHTVTGVSAAGDAHSHALSGATDTAGTATGPADPPYLVLQYLIKT